MKPGRTALTDQKADQLCLFPILGQERLHLNSPDFSPPTDQKPWKS
jgi:hypothetical protein